MDKKRGALNVSVSIVSRIILLLAALVVRRFLIQEIGNDVNGLYSLYASIIGMLSVAELGIGQAIVYSMYSPIVNGDRKQLAALYGLYKKLYHIIGAVILTGGLLVMPLLPHLISDRSALTVDIYTPYILTLISSVVTYLYSARTSLIEAHKDNYITTAILSAARLFRYILQIVTILIWKSFTVYVACQIVETLIIWAVTEVFVQNRYGELALMHAELDPEMRSEIVRNIKAMFMHKIGTILVNSTDSLIISAFIGVIILGKYSNYTFIAGVLSGTISLFFTPLTSIIGHVCAAGDRNQIKRYYYRFYSINFILGMVFFLGYYAIIDDVIELCFGTNLEVSRTIVFIITLNQFTQFMRRTTLLFRDASGCFYYDRWKPIAEAAANLALSLLLVYIFPADYKVAGVIAATIITTLLIVFTVEPYVVFHHLLGISPTSFYIRNYSYIGLFTISLLIMETILRPAESPVTGIFVNGFISVGLSAAVLVILALANKNTFRK